MSSSVWHEVTRQRPCRICRKADWYGVSGQGAARCMRVAEAPQGWRIVKQCDDGGTVFVEADRHPNGPALCSKPLRITPRKDWGAEADRYTSALPAQCLNELAASLGVRPNALAAMGVGWCAAQSCWTFPERTGEGKIIGLNRRFRDGTKKAFAGSRRGLTIPSGLQTLCDPVLVAEGASDVAASLTVDLTAVGRPNNQSGAKHLGGSVTV